MAMRTTKGSRFQRKRTPLRACSALRFDVMARTVRKMSSRSIQKLRRSLYANASRLFHGRIIWLYKRSGLSAFQNLAFVGENDGSGVGDTRTHAEHPFFFLGIEGRIALHLGARTHQAHVALENVPKLKQLIKLPSAHEPAGG